MASACSRRRRDAAQQKQQTDSRYQFVHSAGTMMYMVTDRRPRITPELADKIDTLREEFGIPFERYVNDVLERHVGHALGTKNEDYYRERGGERRHTATDPGGAVLYVDKDNGEHHAHEGVLGLLVIDDEGYDPVGFYMDEQETRALRDVCTELLGEWEGHR